MYKKDEERLEVMAKHYLTAALWADAPEGSQARLTKQAQKNAFEVCKAFCEACGPEMLRAVAQCYPNGYGKHPDCGNSFPVFAAMGHDLRLTSQGHGAGFWDRQELTEELQDSLTAKAKLFQGVYLTAYKGWIYLEG